MEWMQQVLNQLLSGNINGVTTDFIVYCGTEAMRLLTKVGSLNDYDVACLNLLVQISQILYNNTDRNILCLEDGVYDLILEKLKQYNSNFQNGAIPLHFGDNGELISTADAIKTPMEFMDDPETFIKNSLFYENLKGVYYHPQFCDVPIDRNSGIVLKKNTRSVPHKYPKLAGSLDKCKFTLNQEARDKGVYMDTTVKVFERDFLMPLFQKGFLRPDEQFSLLLELKYDGIAVEADVTDHIISARSRGDMAQDKASDLTPLLQDYQFYYCPKMSENEKPFGMQFEAVISHVNLDKLSRLTGKVYKNPRNAIIGLMGATYAYDYRDLITLVPLATSLNIDPVEEVEFMNRYYCKDEPLRWALATGNYEQVLFQVYRFVQEAERMRPMMPYLYDGVVVHIIDPKIRQALGRQNSINKFSMAIKFCPMIKQAVFTGYTYTVGQNGVITPMIHYTPVEFYGGIHTKSSGHSLARFMELNLAPGDVLDIEYVNDVMPYVNKSKIHMNSFAQSKPVPFPTHCPCCGTQLLFTQKSAFCPNLGCEERIVARVTNMLKKLNFKDFSEESVRALKLRSLNDILSMTFDNAKAILGETMAAKFMQRVEQLQTNQIYDYQIIGSLGFEDIAFETWKKIMRKVKLYDIMNTNPMVLNDYLRAIPGIGAATATTIITQLEEFYPDLITISNMPNVTFTYGFGDTKTIRFSGVRDQELCDYLNMMGYDANGNAGVTKTTDILIVPYEGYTSSKTEKVSDKCKIISIDSFKNNIQSYLS